MKKKSVLFSIVLLVSTTLLIALLAGHVIFEVPFQKLSDNATIYLKEQESTEYMREEIKVSPSDKLQIKLSPGNGWAARI
jgi:hypothetical protein